MVSPPHALPDTVSARTSIPLVTTAAAIVDGLHALGARRICVATPYHDALNLHEVSFLASEGIEVLSIRGLGLGANGPVDYPLIAETPLEAVRAHARGAAAYCRCRHFLMSCPNAWLVRFLRPVLLHPRLPQRLTRRPWRT